MRIPIPLRSSPPAIGRTRALVVRAGLVTSVALLLSALSASQALSAQETGALRGRILDADSGMPLAQLEDHIGPIIALDWAPDGSTLISGGEDGTAIMWRLP